MQTIEILLIEDNPGDIELVKMNFRSSKIINNLHVCRDGEEGLNFLFKRAPFTDAVTPDVIFLDLNLPRVDGHQVLKTIKQDETLRHIPVVVMTSSKAEIDIVKSYQLHANCYVTKPITLQTFQDVTQSIEQFWFSVVTLPPNQ